MPGLISKGILWRQRTSGEQANSSSLLPPVIVAEGAAELLFRAFYQISLSEKEEGPRDSHGKRVLGDESK